MADNNGNAHGKRGENNGNSSNANNTTLTMSMIKNRDKMSWDFNIENICYDMQVQSLISSLFPNIGKTLFLYCFLIILDHYKKIR